MTQSLVLLVALAAFPSTQALEAPPCKKGDLSLAAYTSLSESAQTALVDAYRATFEPTFEAADALLREITGGTPFHVEGRIQSGDAFREAILAKGYACFSEITDISAFRVTVADYAALPYLMDAIEKRFVVVEKQSHLSDVERPGYRAVHYLVDIADRVTEIQIRTTRGALWTRAAREHFYDRPDAGVTEVGDYLWELSQAIHLLDSGIDAPIPSTPSDLSSGVRGDLMRVAQQLERGELEVEEVLHDPSPYSLDELGGLRYNWQLDVSSPHCNSRGYRNARVEAYLNNVTQYRRGDVDNAIERLQMFHFDDIDDVIETFTRDNESLSSKCLQAAALLQTEVAIAAIHGLMWTDASPQLDNARKLIRLMPSDEQEAFSRDWLLTMGWVHQAAAFTINAVFGFTEAQEYFGEAVQRFPEDGEVLLAAGSLFEWAGSLSLDEKGFLKEAERLYARSLEAAPDSAEAHLRYGRVLDLRGNYEESRASTMRVLELAGDEVAVYRAHMTLGNLSERAGQLDDARRHYLEAIEIRPNWQVAHVALSHCLHELGARADAKRALEKMFSLPKTQDSALGWWRYQLGLSEGLEAHIRRMREDVAF